MESPSNNMVELLLQIIPINHVFCRAEFLVDWAYDKSKHSVCCKFLISLTMTWSFLRATILLLAQANAFLELPSINKLEEIDL